MSTQHTPGPWKTNGDPVVFSNDLSHFIAFTDTCGISSDAAKANARLIAAEPDLLDALQSYSLAIDDNNIALSCIEFGAEAVERELKRRAAIAKATGAA